MLNSCEKLLDILKLGKEEMLCLFVCSFLSLSGFVLWNCVGCDLSGDCSIYYTRVIAMAQDSGAGYKYMKLKRNELEH